MRGKESLPIGVRKNQYPRLLSTYYTPHSCIKCGAHIGDDWNFCPECGTPTGLTVQDFQDARSGVMDHSGGRDYVSKK